MQLRTNFRPSDIFSVPGSRFFFHGMPKTQALYQLRRVREMINFFSRTFIKRSQAGQRQSIQHEEYTCHVYVKADGLSGIVVTDQEYPPRVAFALLNKLMESYHTELNGSWKSHTGNPKDWPPLGKAVTDYQDPSKADKISAIQKELDETTAILVSHQSLSFDGIKVLITVYVLL